MRVFPGSLSLDVSTEEEKQRAETSRQDLLRTLKASLDESAETSKVSTEEDRRFREGERAHRRDLALIEHLEQTTRLQGEYARRAYTFLRWWMISVGALLVLDAFQRPSVCEKGDERGAICDFIDFMPGLDISDSVLIAVVSSTAVAVIGLVLAVIKGLFSDRRLSQDSS